MKPTMKAPEPYKHSEHTRVKSRLLN